jgi:PAS domain S-box-containing protein
MNAPLEETAEPATTFESLRLELESRQAELEVYRARLGDLERAETLLAGEKRLLEMVAKGDPLPRVLDELCRLFEALCAGSHSTVLLLDAGSKQLRHGAAPSLPGNYVAAINGGIIGPAAGSCGTAAYRGEPVIVSDIATDPLWTDYRETALSHGLRACWSTPIISSENRVLGTFAIYYREPRRPDPRQLAVIDRLTQVASIALERQRAEETLRRSEAYLAEAQRLSLTGSFGWKVSTGELIWSDETYRILEYNRQVEPTLERVFKRVHDQDLDFLRETIKEASQRETTFDFEHRLVMPDGAVKHVHVVARPVKNPSGELEFIGAVMDVTERKHSHETLRAAMARFEGILEIAEDAIISVDSDQRIVLFNQGAEKVFGYYLREVIGQPLDFLLPRRFVPAHRKHVEEFAGSADVARVMGQRREVFGIRKGGGEFPAEASISKLDLGGDVVYTVILRDITERKQAAEALSASERFARGQAETLTRALDAMAMECSPDRLVEHVLRTMTRELEAHSSSIWLKDESSGLVSFEFAYENEAFKTRSEASIVATSHPLRIEEVWPWPEVFRTARPHVLEDIRKDVEFPWRAHLLAQGIVTVIVVPMQLGGQVAGVIGIRFTRHRAFRIEEKELAQALANQAMLAVQLTRLSTQSRQSAVVAERNRMAREIHDTLAQGFAGVIVQLEAAGDAHNHGLAGEAQEHLRRASELARENLKEARRSVQALRPQVLEEKDLFAAIEEMMGKLSKGTGLRAELLGEGDAFALPVDWEENLLRICQEVLTNALRHAQAGRFATRISFAGREVRLEMTDDGRGFDPGAKHDGFGLMGIRERVEAMGGQLTIRSAKGSGTQTFIVLPLKDHAALIKS